MKLLSKEEFQQTSFETLKKLKEIFDENNWKYYLAYGTLIGSIRHQGFIPWDDDIDIIVPRPDYECFIKYCKKHAEELKPFELIHYSTNKKYIFPIARFSNSNYISKSKTEKSYGLGVFVDIYPLDGIDLDDKKYIRNLQKFKTLVTLAGEKPSNGFHFKKPIMIPLYIFSQIKNTNKLVSKLDAYAQKYSFEDSKDLECVAWNYNPFRSHIKKAELGEDCFGIFNNEKFRIPVGYDSLLRRCYRRLYGTSTC